MKKKSIYYLLFLAFFVLSNFQNIAVIEFNSFGLRAYHLIPLFFLFPLIKKQKIKMPPRGILGFVFYALTSSFLNAFWGFGLNSLLFNYIFAFYVMLVIMNFGDSISFDEWIGLLQKGAIIFMIAVCIKNLIQIDVIISFLKSPYGHPLIYRFNEGGPNLEASWLAIYGFLFGSKITKKTMIYNFLSVFTSAIYSSRCAMVINIIWVVWIFLCNASHFKFSYIVGFIFVFSIFIIVGFKNGIFNYIIERFISSGSDMGSLGRINLWKYFPDLITNYPFGVGLGNSVSAIESVSGTDYLESNMHNLYMQMFVDLGIVGGIYYLILILYFLVKEYKKIFNPVIIILFCYFLISLLQYRGAETPFIIFLSTYLIYVHKQNKVTKLSLGHL